MSESLKNVFSKISSDEKLFSQFMEKNTITEIYEFCLGIQDGEYSKDDVEKIVIALLKKLIDLKSLSEEELSKVGGGISFGDVFSILGSAYSNSDMFFSGRQRGLLLKSVLDAIDSIDDNAK